MQSSYIAHVLADGPFVYFVCDDKDKVMRDAGPNKYHGTWFNNPTSTEYRDGAVVGTHSRGLVATSNQYGRSAILPNISRPQFSFEFWLRPVHNRNYNHQISLGTATVNSWGHWLTHSGVNGEIWTGVNGTDGSGRFAGLGNYYLPLNAWLFYTYTYDNGAARLYKNGSPFSTSTHATPATGYQYLWIGGSGDTLGITGQVSHVAGFEKVLTPERIAARYAMGTRGKAIT